jgi:hypothetical protein
MTPQGKVIIDRCSTHCSAPDITALLEMESELLVRTT